MTVPYDNYGKGHWNRARKGDKYRKRIGEIDFDKPANPKVKKTTKKTAQKTTITYG